MKMRLKEFILENKGPNDFEEFKDVDCSEYDNLNDDEKEYCRRKRLIDIMRKSAAGN